MVSQGTQMRESIVTSLYLLGLFAHQMKPLPDLIAFAHIFC